MTKDDKLRRAVHAAQARYEAMPPAEREAHDRAQRESFMRSMKLPDLTAEEIAERVAEYRKVEEDLIPGLRWTGEGDPPRRWIANGTIVYRSYADSVDD